MHEGNSESSHQAGLSFRYTRYGHKSNFSSKGIKVNVHVFKHDIMLRFLTSMELSFYSREILICILKVNSLI